MICFLRYVYLIGKVCLLGFAFLFCSLTCRAGGGVQFLPNTGQWAAHIHARADIPGGRMWITDSGLTYLFVDGEKLHRIQHQEIPPSAVDAHAVKVNFLGANFKGEVIHNQSSSDYFNFYIGKNKSKWRSGIRAYRELIFKEVYPKIDFVIRGLDDAVKYDFILHPGADPKLIRLQYYGQSDVALTDGSLHVYTRFGQIQEDEPLILRLSDEGAVMDSVGGRYVLNGNILSFFIEAYNPEARYDIDPQIIFSTFSGSVADNFGYTATFDDFGHGYSGGTVYDINFPVSPGAFQMDFAGGKDTIPTIGDISRDIGILKYSSDGTQRLYATYLGGTHNEDPHSMIVNSKNELLVFGNSYSRDYPITPGAYDTIHNGMADIIVTHFTADGKGLIASTFVGGSHEDGLNGRFLYDSIFKTWTNASALFFNYADSYRGEIIVDSNDRVLVVTTTKSTDFPASAGSQKTYGGGLQDACVLRLSADLSRLDWGTYLGGSNDDAGYGIGLLSTGDIYVCGGTISPDFPMVGKNYQSQFQGGATDGFVAAFSPNGDTLKHTTFLGTDAYDQCHLLQVDKQDSVYVTGQTQGAWPIKGKVRVDNNARQFITKLSPELDRVTLSTVFGSMNAQWPNVSPVAFLVDDCGYIYFSGWGGNVNYHGNTFGMPITTNAFQDSTDGSDFYLAVFASRLDQLLYASYFGGPVSQEHVDGGTSRFDKRGIVYQSVCAGCGGHSDFPTTAGAWSNINPARRPGRPQFGGCNNALFKFDLGVSRIDFSYVIDTCPRWVEFKDESFNSYGWAWDFGDGVTSTLQNPRHRYSAEGDFKVRLVINPSSQCADTLEQQVTVRHRRTADFDWQVKDTCTGLVGFRDRSPNSQNWYWNFGDGDTSHLENPEHRYKKYGDYSVRLIINYTFTCADTIIRQVHLEPPPHTADFSWAVLDSCRALVQFYDQSPNSPSWFWDFGDGDTSHQQNPQHRYEKMGDYNVRLIINHNQICADTTTKQIHIIPPPPTADFSWTVLDTCSGYVRFRDQSLDGQSWYWDFGDGDTSHAANPLHRYDAFGTYTVRLVVNDTLLCADTISQTITLFAERQARFSYTLDTCALLVSFINQSHDGTSFYWDFGDGRAPSHDAAPVHAYNKNGVYAVTLVLNPGSLCTDTLVQVVDVASQKNFDFFVPNIITPNGDRKNDEFRILGLDARCEEYEIFVYNRWGQLMYHEQGKDLVWHATTPNGDPALEGVYYIIVRSDEIGEYKTTLTVVR